MEMNECDSDGKKVINEIERRCKRHLQKTHHQSAEEISNELTFHWAGRTNRKEVSIDETHLKKQFFQFICGMRDVLSNLSVEVKRR